MKYLPSHEYFEVLIGRKIPEEPQSQNEQPDLTIIWFSAEWCAPCKKIQIDSLISHFPADWLKCDIDKNDYTAGYCNIRSIPSFLVVYKKKIVGIKSSSNTNEISSWLSNIYKDNNIKIMI